MATISEGKIKFWTQELIGILNRKLVSLRVHSPINDYGESRSKDWEEAAVKVFPEIQEDLAILEGLEETRDKINKSISDTMYGVGKKLGWSTQVCPNSRKYLLESVVRTKEKERELMFARYGKAAEEYFKIQEEIRLLPRKLMLASTPDDLKTILEGILSTYNLTLDK